MTSVKLSGDELIMSRTVNGRDLRSTVSCSLDKIRSTQETSAQITEVNKAFNIDGNYERNILNLRLLIKTDENMKKYYKSISLNVIT